MEFESLQENNFTELQSVQALHAPGLIRHEAIRYDAENLLDPNLGAHPHVLQQPVSPSVTQQIEIFIYSYLNRHAAYYNTHNKGACMYDKCCCCFLLVLLKQCKCHTNFLWPTSSVSNQREHLGTWKPFMVLWQKSGSESFELQELTNLKLDFFFRVFLLKTNKIQLKKNIFSE